MAKYYAVVKRRSDDELQHFKYISKKKVNGKWKYFYDDSELRKFDKGVTETRDNNMGGKTETTYEKTDKLFSDSTTISIGNTYQDEFTTRRQGKISRASAKAEKWIYDSFLDPQANERIKDNVEKVANKGKSFLQGLIDGSGIKKAQGKSQVKKASLNKGIKATSNAVNKVAGDLKKARDNVNTVKLDKGITRTTDTAKKAVNNYKTAKSTSEKANTIIKSTAPAFNKTANKLNDGTTSTANSAKKAVKTFKATESAVNKINATTKTTTPGLNKTANKLNTGTTATAKVGKEAVDKLRNNRLDDVRRDQSDYQSIEDLIKRSSTTHGGGGRRDNDRGKRSHGGGGRRR